MKLCDINREYGLLSLEEALEFIDDKNFGNFLKSAVLMIVDGTEIERILEILTNRYWADSPTEINALLYYIYIRGTFFVQNNAHLNIIKETMLSLIPYTYYEDCNKFITQTMNEYYKNKEDYYINKYKSINYSLDDENIKTLIQELENIFKEMSDKDIQRLLRDVDSTVLENIIISMSEKSRNKIFNNMSKSLEKKIMAEIGKRYNCENDIDKDEIEQSANNVLGIISTLRKIKEIE